MRMRSALKIAAASASLVGMLGCVVITGPDDLPGRAIDGTWTLQSINNTPMANLSPGYDIPTSSNFLRGGTLQFTTNIVWASEASLFTLTDLLHEGVVLGTDMLVNAQGGALPSHSRGGKFEYDPDLKSVTVSAANRSITGTVTGSGGTLASTMTFTQQDVPTLGVVTLVFRKTAQRQ